MTIHDKADLISLVASYKSSSVSIEIPRNYKDFTMLAKPFFSHILEIIQVQSIERIGLRLYYTVEQDSFKSLVHKIRKDMLRLEKKQYESLIIGNRNCCLL